MTDDSPCPRIQNTAELSVIGSSGEMTIPYGETTFTELKALYKEKIAFCDEKSSAFLLDGMSLLADLRAAMFVCRHKNKPVYAVIPVDNELLTEHELPADAALIVMQSLGASCFGISSDDEETLIDGIKELKPYAEIPLAVKPENGCLSDEAITELLSAGTDIFFGLSEECGKRVQRIIDMKRYDVEEHVSVDSVMLANERSAFFLEHDTTEISEPFICNASMSEELFEASEQHGYDVLRIQLDTPDDALDFADNAHMASLPIMFISDDPMALKLALMLYQGRALIDSTGLIEEEELLKAAKKYGAVIY